MSVFANSRRCTSEVLGTAVYWARRANREVQRGDGDRNDLKCPSIVIVLCRFALDMWRFPLAGRCLHWSRLPTSCGVVGGCVRRSRLPLHLHFFEFVDGREVA